MVWKTLLEKLVWPLLVASLMGLGVAFTSVRDLARENSLLFSVLDGRLGSLERAFVDPDNRYTQREAERHHAADERERAEIRADIYQLEQRFTRCLQNCP